MKPEDREGALAQGELSGPEADAIWQRVANDPRVRPKRQRFAWLGAAIVATTAAIALVVVRPIFEHELRDKGAAVHAVIDIDCVGACEPGARLAITVSYLMQPAVLDITATAPSGARMPLSHVPVMPGRHFTLRDAPTIPLGAGPWHITANVRDASGVSLGQAARDVLP
jgi:hypothetical protein